jgi:hypothetical protein
MKCPNCYKTDLHPQATKCHHCGGDIDHGHPLFKSFLFLGLLLIIWGFLGVAGSDGLAGNPDDNIVGPIMVGAGSVSILISMFYS